jgi:hypothetical protein
VARISRSCRRLGPITNDRSWLALAERSAGHSLYFRAEVNSPHRPVGAVHCFARLVLTAACFCVSFKLLVQGA